MELTFATLTTDARHRGDDAGKTRFLIAIHDIKLSVARSPQFYSRPLLVRRTDQQHRFVLAAPDATGESRPAPSRKANNVFQVLNVSSSSWRINSSFKFIDKLCSQLSPRLFCHQSPKLSESFPFSIGPGTRAFLPFLELPSCRKTDNR